MSTGPQPPSSMRDKSTEPQPSSSRRVEQANYNSNAVGVTAGEIKMIQRDKENPFMFFRVGGQARSIDRSEDRTVQCLAGSREILLMARRLIQINLVTFSLLSSMLPQNIIH